MNSLIRALLALLVSAVLPHAASADINITELASGVAIPFFAEVNGLQTTAVITNASGQDRTLHFDLLNGDPDEGWEVQSWICTLTGRETTQILFLPISGSGQLPPGPEFKNTEVLFDCDGIEGQDGPPYAGNKGIVLSSARRGVLWVTVQNNSGQTIADNVLFADFTLFDAGLGVAATAPAAGFQGSGNDGNKKYDFDGNEYSRFPAALAVNYLPPSEYAARLLVFTLDGIPGLEPKVRARINWYDDDEFFEDDALTFKCIELLEYDDIALGLGALPTAGHMEILPVFEPNQERKRPMLCYNIQDGPDGGSGIQPCNQSTASFDNQPQPSLDTQL